MGYAFAFTVCVCFAGAFFGLFLAVGYKVAKWMVLP